MSFRTLVWIIAVAVAATWVAVGLALFLRSDGSEETTFDTSGMRARTSSVCNIPPGLLRDEQVGRDAVSWLYTDGQGRQRVASLSFVGQGISCG